MKRKPKPRKPRRVVLMTGTLSEGWSSGRENGKWYLNIFTEPEEEPKLRDFLLSARVRLIAEILE